MDEITYTHYTWYYFTGIINKIKRNPRVEKKQYRWRSNYPYRIKDFRFWPYQFIKFHPFGDFFD